MTASPLFRHDTKSYSLRDFFDSQHSLPFILHIDEGFMGFNEVDTIGSSQYFFIHAIYRQRRVIARGCMDGVSIDKQLLSIPLGYPIKFRMVESRLHVGEEEPLHRLVKRHRFPFECQMSRTENASFTVGRLSRKTSDISNLLLIGEYKEIYLLGNNLHPDTGSLNLRTVAIPLYIPQIRVSVVNGLHQRRHADWMFYKDSLYAFALQEIDLHQKFGNQDIFVFAEVNIRKQGEPLQKVYECMFPKEIVRIKQPSDQRLQDISYENTKPPPLPPKSTAKYECAWIGPGVSNSQGGTRPTSNELKQLEKHRDQSLKRMSIKEADRDPIFEISGRLSGEHIHEEKVMKLQRQDSKQELETRPEVTQETSRSDSIKSSMKKVNPLLFAQNDMNPMAMESLNQELLKVCKPRQVSESESDVKAQEFEKRRSRKEDDAGTYSKSVHRTKHIEEAQDTTPIKHHDYGDETYTAYFGKGQYSGKDYEKSRDRRVHDAPKRTENDVYEDHRRRKKDYQSWNPGNVKQQSEDEYYRGSPDRHDSYPPETTYSSGRIPRLEWDKYGYASASKSRREQPITRDLTQVPFEDMTTTDVCEVLNRLNLEKHIDEFRHNLVDGLLLKDLTEELLKTEFRFTSLETMRILKFIRNRHIPK